MILIRNGRLIDPKHNIDRVTDIVIEGNKIAKIGKMPVTEQYEEIIDATGLIIAPGLIDVHVHFREPGFTYKEDILSGAQSAATGGFTSVVCMANTKPVVDNEETLKEILEKAKQAPIHVYTCAAVSKGFEGKELTDMGHLKELGAVGFTDDGLPLMDTALLRLAMRKVKELDVPISLHEEDPALIASSGVNQGTVSEQIGFGGAPAIAEDVMVARDCMLAMETGAKVSIQHISSRHSVNMVRFAKEQGAPVVAEATPQHFSATEDLVLTQGTLAKVNPPLRTEEDRYGIIQGLKDDTIDLIVTDHAPHSPEEKNRPMAQAPSGMIGLETSLGLSITHLVRKGHLSMRHMLEKMTVNPAELYQLDAGYIGIGGPADIVLFDEYEEWIVPENFVSKSNNSPFIGEKLYGKVKYTICGGKIVYKDV